MLQQVWPGKRPPFPMLRGASGKTLRNRPSRPHTASKDNSHPLQPPSHTHIHNRRAVRYRNGFYSFPVCRNTHHTQHASHTHSTHSNDQLKVIHIFVVHTHFTPRPPSKKKGEKKNAHTRTLFLLQRETGCSLLLLLFHMLSGKYAHCEGRVPQA